jgi:hypothetical protein
MPLLCVGFAVDFLRSNPLPYLLLDGKNGLRGLVTAQKATAIPYAKAAIQGINPDQTK